MPNPRNNQPEQDQERPQQLPGDTQKRQQYDGGNKPDSDSDDGETENPSDVARSGRSVVHPESDTDDESDDETAGRDPM